MACFSKLPPETALDIVKFMPTTDCLALSRTCRKLHTTLTPHLYANVKLKLKFSEDVEARDPLEMLYEGLVMNEERRPWVTALSIHTYILLDWERDIIASLINLLPRLRTFKVVDARPAKLSRAFISSLHNTSQRGSRLPHGSTNLRPSPLAPPALLNLKWMGGYPSKEYIQRCMDFIRPLSNLRVLQLDHDFWTLGQVDANILPNLESLAASTGVALEILPNRDIQRLKASTQRVGDLSRQIEACVFDTVKVLALQSGRCSQLTDIALIRSMPNLEVLDISYMATIYPSAFRGTKLKFLRVHQFISTSTIGLLFQEIETLQCVERVIKSETKQAANGDLVEVVMSPWGSRTYRDALGTRDTEWTCGVGEEWLFDWRVDIRDSPRVPWLQFTLDLELAKAFRDERWGTPGQTSGADRPPPLLRVAF
ncbi:hypothetical protein BDN71DRAFT_1437159 [Pleurotus eryngii]|uniref:F-box domain-containing protein n=1 Tax=Pleurotus eryngii TaxID=5323 RepID=A0A9P5ZJI6_PLEER|nr:hypothetical protein BDN71DRAFT_1437159 [Pleurotus eryngii]